MVAEHLDLNGAAFELVCVRRTGVAVFRGDGTYLRWGSAIPGELEVQRRVLEQGYPVPDIVEVGEHAGVVYVIEESLGVRTPGRRLRRSKRVLPDDQRGVLDVPGHHASTGSRSAEAHEAMAPRGPGRLPRRRTSVREPPHTRGDG